MYDNTQRGSAVAWVALIVSIVALILAWLAFNRAGEDLEALIEQEVNQAVLELQTEVDELETNIQRNTGTTTNQ